MQRHLCCLVVISQPTGRRCTHSPSSKHRDKKLAEWDEPAKNDQQKNSRSCVARSVLPSSGSAENYNNKHLYEQTACTSTLSLILDLSLSLSLSRCNLDHNNNNNNSHSNNDMKETYKKRALFDIIL